MGVLAATIGAGIELRRTTWAGGPPFSVERANEGRRLIRRQGGGIFRGPEPRGELGTLVPANACTSHKSQGSEYPAEVIPLLTLAAALSGVHRHHQLLAAVDAGCVGLTRGLAVAARCAAARR